MAKSKTQKSKSKTKHVDDDEEQMKSRKEPADDEAADVEVEDADKEAAKVDTDAADEEATEVHVDDAEAEPETDADAEAKAGDAEPPDDDEDEKSVDEGPVAPPAKITKTVMVLILLNWIAAPTFLVFAYLDNMARVQFSYRTMLNYVQIWGLPLKSEDNSTLLSNEARSLIVLSPEQLKAAVRSRPGVKLQSQEFAPFEETLDKRIPFRLRPKDISPELLRDVFQGLDKAVPTLDDEIDRLKESLPNEIKEAAGAVKEAITKKTDDEKRAIVKKALAPFSWDSAHAKKLEAQLDETKGANLDDLVKRTVIRNVLFTIAWDVKQVEKLNKRLENIKDAKVLDELLDDAVQRRIYYDILAPINVFRPGDIKDVKNYKIEKLSDLGAYKLEDVKGFMEQRLKAAIADKHAADFHLGDYWTKAEPSPDAMKRDSIEKRQKIAFIMFALGQVTVPGLDKTPLFPKGVERAQIVCGLYEFTNSSIQYVRVLRILEERIKNSVAGDRQGHSHLLAELLKLTPEEFINRFDKDGDGKLSRDEFGASLAKAFAAADKNGDGKLDREEVAGLQAMLRKNQEMTRTGGFVDDYENEIDRLVKIVEHIDGEQKRLADLKVQLDHSTKTYRQRVKQHEEALKKLIEARKKTEEYVKDLRERQDQLHAALVELSEAGDRNFQLYLQIRDIELSYRNQKTKKEGKKQP